MGAPILSSQALKEWKGEIVGDRLLRRAGGLEAEFSLFVDGRLAKPEDIFGDPRGFISVPLMHRTGRSFQLPNGAAVYFDTGVIEIATPAMELERGCFGRLARSLDEGVGIVRGALDAWERDSGRKASLQGFSTHYNISIAERDGRAVPPRHLKALAWLLVHILPAPVMLLTTNRRSTGVGLRPRPRRMEVTADFPPDPTRLAATGAVIAGIVDTVTRWRNLEVSALRGRGIPVVKGFWPRPHTTRRGWLARFDCYPHNPFVCGPDAPIWTTVDGLTSLRTIAQRVFATFETSIRRFADPFSFRVASRIISGKTRSWLEDPDRPASYDDVGNATPSYPQLQRLGLSRYERVVLNAMAGRSLHLGTETLTPVGMRGWSRVVFRRERDGGRAVLPLDTLIEHLDEWEAA